MGFLHILDILSSTVQAIFASSNCLKWQCIQYSEIDFISIHF